ncbi:RNase adapter RapZ [Streptomyces erythrochromogenes]|uniref:RapZ C-terminal domain-containing protein n=1 Tax=Streptomyces erythrochromogenes TaxID=285574 RepID=UPI00342E6805
MIKTIAITSFGYGPMQEEGKPLLTVPQADITLDLRRILPAADDVELEGLTGLDGMVYERVLASTVTRGMAVQTAVGVHMLMEDTDVTHLTIAVGSSDGRRRAVVVARHIQTRLAQLSASDLYTVTVTHRDLGTDSRPRHDGTASGEAEA